MEYLKRDVARILGKRPNTIEYYTNEGLVVPDIEPSAGRGKPRIYSRRNLVEFGMIDVMQKMGASLELASLVLHILRKGTWTPSGVFLKDTRDAKKAVERAKRSSVSFDDFWTSEEWGRSRELVFIDTQGITEDGQVAHEHWVEVSEKPVGDAGFTINRMFDSRVSLARVLWLGSIKQAAEKAVFE